jgi:hypothetical protein
MFNDDHDATQARDGENRAEVAPPGVLLANTSIFDTLKRSARALRCHMYSHDHDATQAQDGESRADVPPRASCLANTSFFDTLKRSARALNQPQEGDIQAASLGAFVRILMTGGTGRIKTCHYWSFHLGLPY